MMRWKKMNLAIVVTVALLTGCGQSAAAIPSDAATPSGPSGSSSSITVAAATPVTASSGASSTSNDPSTSSDPLVRGRYVFEVKAGGTGCQLCHGMDAKGVVGPNIRGKTPDEIRQALQSVDLMMTAIKNVDSDDIKAVSAYLQWLATQP